MTKPIRLAIVGATGLVGETLLELLPDTSLDVAELHLLASEHSAGDTRLYRNKKLIVGNVADFDFSTADVAIFSAGKSVAAQYAPIAAEKNCLVIDNSSQFRYDDDVPLVVPEVNADILKNDIPRGIIANPNCSTIQMVVALKPIVDAVGVSRVNVATYQSVSGAGKKAVEELGRQTAALLGMQSYPPEVFPKQIAFNVIPQIDVFEENGYTREEMKMVWETKKILGDPEIQVNPTAVRVPVFYGHGMAVHAELKDSLSAPEARKLLKKAPGIKIIDGEDYPTQVAEGSTTNFTYIGRIREDISSSKGLNFWVVADNLRKGAALNALQVTEKLVEFKKV